MQGNLGLLTTLHVIMTLALVGSVPFIFRRLEALRRQQSLITTLVYRLMDNQRLDKGSADDLPQKK
ncbi:MAG: hypothetical protein QOH31_2050 [Verrucomicrobiota bacterium]|jgi:hypothetical protein